MKYEFGEMRKCPTCKKEFIHNPQSIYKIVTNTKIKRYCSYTCWRKAGGGKSKVDKKIQEELQGRKYIG